ncbi:hypothetical protein [Elizabethkingia meningoseptica]|uniref:hypothetical protein n=1 Tax=Elizabethkingia meningoseptica TaxID=238 RepID=UPI00301A7E89
MKKQFFLSVIGLILASCSISYAEPYADVWDINPQKKIILSPNNTKVHDFDLVNISSENNLLQIYAINGKLLKTIGKGEKARFKEISLNGIIIENNSNNKGSVQFYSKERRFKLPKLRIETKETE